MPAKHQYLVADLVTDQPLGTIDAAGVSYSRRIMAQGSFNAELPVTSNAVGDLVRLMTKRPVALYARRQVGTRSELWWGGILWTAAPRRDKRGRTSAALIGATFDSITTARYIWDDIAETTVDRGLLLADLWDHLQTRDGNSSIDLEVTPVALGGEPFTKGWDGAASTSYADAMHEVSSAEPPFEWTIDVYADPDGTRHRSYRQGTPLLGDPAGRLLFCSPANLLGFEWSGENQKNATHALARGAAVATAVGGDTVPITSGVRRNPDVIADGAPRVDVVVDYPDETDETRLPAHADSLVARGAPKPTVKVRLPDNSPINPGILGSTGRVWIEDPCFDGGVLDTTARLIGMTVKPAQRGSDEEVTLEFQPDTGAVEAA